MNLSESLIRNQREADWNFAALVAMDPDTARESCGWLAPSALSVDVLARFWELVQKGEGVASASRKAAGTLPQELSRRVARVPDFATPLEYAREIAQLAYLRETAGRLEEAGELIARHDTDRLGQVLQDLSKATAPGQQASRRADDSLKDFADMVKNIGGRTIKTGIGPLDQALGGFERKGLTVITARPSIGKSALAWQIARNAAAGGNRVVFFSLEDSEANLWARAVCGPAGISWRELRARGATAEEVDIIQDLAEAEREKYGDRLYINDRRNTSGDVWREIANLRPDLFVLDHLRLLKDTADSEVRRLGFMTERMKDAAKEYNAAAIVLAQLNRGLEGRENKRPRLSDLRDSGEIEENADTVLGMYRDDYYTGVPVEVAETELNVLKFRSDAANKVIKLGFHLARQQFVQLSTVNLNGSRRQEENVQWWTK